MTDFRPLFRIRAAIRLPAQTRVDPQEFRADWLRMERPLCRHRARRREPIFCRLRLQVPAIREYRVHPMLLRLLPQFLPPCRRDPLPRCPLLGPRPFASRTAPAESRSMHTACAVPSGRNSQVLLRPDFLLSGADRRLLRVSAPTDRCHSDKPWGLNHALAQVSRPGPQQLHQESSLKQISQLLDDNQPLNG